MADATEKKSAFHPPYPEMIFAAIDSLAEKDGSNKSSILNHIETTYRGSLQGNHEADFTEALAKMKDSGELILFNNNYKKADANIVARRGRGRPPKPKAVPVPGEAKPTPRPRGRPPKPKDPLAVVIAKVGAGFPRSRGRPKLVRPLVVAPLPKTVAGVKRGRGRPPKARVSVA